MTSDNRLAQLAWRARYHHGAWAASRARLAALRLTHQHVDLTFGDGVRIGPRFDLMFPGPGTLRIGDACEFRRDFFCEVAPGAVIDIGPQTVFTSSALIQISTDLTIGRRAVFGQSVMIADGNHKFRDHTQHLLDQGYEFRSIEIGDGAIVTSKCTILNSIGAGAVIGANSVVTRPIPAYCLAVGSPARPVEYFGPPESRPDGVPQSGEG